MYIAKNIDTVLVLSIESTDVLKNARITLLTTLELILKISNAKLVRMRKTIPEIFPDFKCWIHPHHRLLDRRTHRTSEPWHHHAIATPPSFMHWICWWRTGKCAKEEMLFVLGFKRRNHITFQLMKVAFGQQWRNKNNNGILSGMKKIGIGRVDKVVGSWMLIVNNHGWSKRRRREGSKKETKS